jgi:hypothetical protein
MEKVVEEIERLQEAVWQHQSREAELRRALEAALPLLLHACDGRNCRRCRALETAEAALRGDTHQSEKTTKSK